MLPTNAVTNHGMNKQCKHLLVAQMGLPRAVQRQGELCTTGHTSKGRSRKELPGVRARQVVMSYQKIEILWYIIYHNIMWGMVGSGQPCIYIYIWVPYLFQIISVIPITSLFIWFIEINQDDHHVRVSCSYLDPACLGLGTTLQPLRAPGRPWGPRGELKGDATKWLPPTWRAVARCTLQLNWTWGGG